MLPPREADTDELPEDIRLHDEDLAFRVFTILEAVEWKWTPREVLRQPDLLLDDVIQLRSLAEKIKRMKPNGG